MTSNYAIRVSAVGPDRLHEHKAQVRGHPPPGRAGAEGEALICVGKPINLGAVKPVNSDFFNRIGLKYPSFVS